MTTAAAWTAAATWTDAARELWKRVKCALHLGYVVVRAWYRTCTRAAAPPHHHGPRLYKVYAFNESDGEEGAQGYYRDISPAYFEPSTWEADAKELTGWSKLRVELRYAFRNKKYRMVLHEGDACAFPPYDEPDAPACRLPKGVLSARLQGPLGSDVDCDVTPRTMKYQGPKGDFHAGLGLHVKVHDMFPFDDQSDNSARFSHLRIMDTRAQLHDFAYADNPAVSISAART